MMNMDMENAETDLHALKAWLINRGLTVEMRDHPCYTKAIESGFVSLTNLCGTDQLLVSDKNGKISVIRGGCSFGNCEIFSIEGGLFEDIERYSNVKEAGERIYELLTDERDTGEKTNSDSRGLRGRD